MMGVYMLIIAIADLQFGENYHIGAKRWRSSAVCKIAGVLSVLSSEASVFFITIISIECFLGIVFPFRSIKIRGKNPKVIASILWSTAACLSIVPTLTSSSDSNVYGLSDVCVGLPLITSPTYLYIVYFRSSVLTEQISTPVYQWGRPYWIYSIFLFVGVNLLCFMVVLCCYTAMFVSVKNTATVVRVTAHRKREIGMAIKMALIVGTDFACWMPIIIMGILSQTGTVELSIEMFSWVAVFIVPINSSVNPYLYTIYTKVANKLKNAKANDAQIHLNLANIRPRWKLVSCKLKADFLWYIHTPK